VGKQSSTAASYTLASLTSLPLEHHTLAVVRTVVCSAPYDAGETGGEHGGAAMRGRGAVDGALSVHHRRERWRAACHTWAGRGWRRSCCGRWDDRSVCVPICGGGAVRMALDIHHHRRRCFANVAGGQVGGGVGWRARGCDGAFASIVLLTRWCMHVVRTHTPLCSSATNPEGVLGGGLLS
jgi:hypothetical protein